MSRRFAYSILAAVVLASFAFTSAPGRAANASPALAGLRDLGRAPASTRVDVALVLKYHNAAELERLVESQVDEDSPLYHHFLNQGQFQNYFAPTPAEYGRAIQSLHRAGFTITHTYANRTIVDASAPAPFAERYFATEIHRVVQPGDGIRYVNLRPGTLPTEIRDIALSVVGLSNLHTMRPTYRFLPRGQARPALSGMSYDAAPLFGPDGGYGPQVYLNSYAMPGGKGTTGTGRASGVVGDADFLDSDLAGYLSYFQVNRTGPATTRVLVDGGPPPGNQAGDSIETALDVETIVSLAPGTALYVYEAPESGTLMYFADMYNQIVTDNFVDTVNTSYGQCETAFDKSLPTTLEAIFVQGTAEGITFHSSSGDSGIYTYGCSGSISVLTPTDTPHTTSIGGTTMEVDHSTGFETSEIAWGSAGFGTGGGVSVVFKEPKFQKGTKNIITSGRNEPDVAFDADPGTGESYYYNGSFQGPIGGTSLASPIFGAGMTEIAQIKKARAGWFNPTLYAFVKKHGYGKGKGIYIRDIVVGSDPPYKAQKGYDQMTGFGALIFNNIEKKLP